MCYVWGWEEGGGVVIIWWIFFIVFSCFRPFWTVFKFFSPTTILFQKIHYFDGWGGTFPYHHFTVGGISDSNLYHLLHLSSAETPEALCSICCKHDQPIINSSHDLIISKFQLTPILQDQCTTSTNIVAPHVENDRVKIQSYIIVSLIHTKIQEASKSIKKSKKRLLCLNRRVLNHSRSVHTYHHLKKEYADLRKEHGKL